VLKLGVTSIRFRGVQEAVAPGAARHCFGACGLAVLLLCRPLMSCRPLNRWERGLLARDGVGETLIHAHLALSYA